MRITGISTGVMKLYQTKLVSLAYRKIR